MTQRIGYANSLSVVCAVFLSKKGDLFLLVPAWSLPGGVENRIEACRFGASKWHNVMVMFPKIAHKKRALCLLLFLIKVSNGFFAFSKKNKQGKKYNAKLTLLKVLSFCD